MDKELRNLKKQEKRKKVKKANKSWIIVITILAFVISFIFSFASETIISNVNVIIGTIILLLFILIGIMFDMVGVAVNASNIAPLNSMSARKVKGAKVAVKFKKSADKVSSFCNDVIGDVCGVVSGGAGVIIARILSTKFNADLFLTTLIVMSLVSSLTIGGKAIMKSYAVRNAEVILYKFARLIARFKK
jgi:CBS domain containing-hemolysin-like protein